MNKRQIASELVKIAKSLVAESISVGDVCKVDMKEVTKALGGGVPERHWLSILRKVIRQGDGLVYVDEIGKFDAMVSSHGNPAARMLGGVSVPLSALQKVGTVDNNPGM